MIQAISMNMDDMKEILDALPDELKEKIMKQLKPDSGLEYIKNFIEKYDDDDMIDHIIAHTIANLISKIGNAATKCRKEWCSKGDHFSAIDMGMTVIECLKDEAKNIQNALDKHEQECERGDDRGAKH